MPQDQPQQPVVRNLAAAQQPGTQSVDAASQMNAQQRARLMQDFQSVAMGQVGGPTSIKPAGSCVGCSPESALQVPAQGFGERAGVRQPTQLNGTSAGFLLGQGHLQVNGGPASPAVQRMNELPLALIGFGGNVFADLSGEEWVRKVVMGPLTRALIPYPNPWGNTVGSNEEEGYDHDNLTDDHTLYVRVSSQRTYNGDELSFELHAGIGGPNRKKVTIASLTLTVLRAYPGTDTSIAMVSHPLKISEQHTDYDTGTFKKVVGKANTPGTADYVDILPPGPVTIMVTGEATDSDGHMAQATLTFVF